MKKKVLQNITHFPSWRWNENIKSWQKIFFEVSDKIQVTDSAQIYPSVSKDKISILTFNVLFDRIIRPSYEFPSEHAVDRFYHAFQAIEALSPDVICLQEVTARFTNELLAQPWVKSSYYSSYLPESECLHPYGQLTLSKIPMIKVWTYRFGSTSIKRCLFTEWRIGNRKFTLANTHLPADHRDSQRVDVKQRIGQLGRIFSLLSEIEGDKIIAGDFNFGDNDEYDENAKFDECRYHDVWKMLNQQRPGYTNDPTSNDLSQVLCPGMQPVRLDRIYISSAANWLPYECTLVLKDPFQVIGDHAHLFPSDHFGVLAKFHLFRNNNNSKTQNDDE